MSKLSLAGITGAVGGFVNSALGLGQSASRDQGKVAATLLTKSPIELKTLTNEEQAKADPLGLSTIQYPSDLTSNGLGHYMIFYTIKNNHSGGGMDFAVAKEVGFSSAETYEEEEFAGEETTMKQGTAQTADTYATVSKGTIGNLRLGSTKEVSSPNQVAPATSNTSTVTSAIALYMPAAIKATYKNTWETDEANLAGDIMQTANQVANANSRGQAFDSFVQGMGGAGMVKVKEFLSGAMDAMGGGDIFRLYSKSLGMAINPRNEQFYVGPNFRSFSYSFEFWPKNKKETDDVQNIIKLFKYHSHPLLENSKYNGRMFITPSEFEIHYMHKNGPNEYLNKLSRCARTSVDVTYGPEAQWSTFEDGSPVSYKLDLEFTELEFLTKDRIYKGDR